MIINNQEHRITKGIYFLFLTKQKENNKNKIFVNKFQ